jgi:predicted metal-dependent hydrolase
MNTIDIINLVAAGLSIISAIASFIILLINKTIRDEIINKKDIKDYTEFIAKSKILIDNIRKFTNAKPRALSIDKFIEYLKNYYELVKDIEHKLVKNGIKAIVNSINDLEEDIQFYANNGNKDFKENIERLNKTYFNIIGIQKNIKEVIDNKIY